MPGIRRTRPRARRTSSPTGDPDAIALSSQQQIERHAHRMLDRPLGYENAESIAADVWLWVIERRAIKPGFLSTPEAFRQGIHRKLFDELRKVVRDLKRFEDDSDVDEIIDAGSGGRAPRRNSPDEIFAESETAWYVQRAIAQLPPQMQRVIRLYDLEGWSVDEVALELGITPGTVRQIRHQAKAKLRKLLDSFGGLQAA